MLAGALFNRATDIFTKLVELQACGVEIHADNALMRQCGEHLQESLALGQMVLHRSGEEGIDELWGEPFKAFAFPIEEFYRSRYVKIALAMRAIDSIGDALRTTIAALPAFTSLLPVVDEFVHTAKLKSERCARIRRVRGLVIVRGGLRNAVQLSADCERRGSPKLRAVQRAAACRLAARVLHGSRAGADAKSTRERSSIAARTCAKRRSPRKRARRGRARSLRLLDLLELGLLALSAGVHFGDGCLRVVDHGAGPRETCPWTALRASHPAEVRAAEQCDYPADDGQAHDQAERAG